jgi:hypothetical protein
MLRPVLALAIAVLLFSCGEANDPSCGFEEGVYTVQYRTLNGDCPDMELRVASPRAFPPECTQTFTYDDQCAVNVVRECSSEGLYGRYVLTLEPRGRDYFGLYQVSGPVSSERSCSGLYDVTYVAQ